MYKLLQHSQFLVQCSEFLGCRDLAENLRSLSTFSSANKRKCPRIVLTSLSRSYAREPAGISHCRDMMGEQVRICLHHLR